MRDVWSWQTLLTLLVGIVPTVLASRYFFRQGLGPRLRIYLDFHSPVFGAVQEDVRRDLKILWRDKEIEEIHYLRFIVATQGYRAVLSPIVPLTLRLMPSIEILDAAIDERAPDNLAIRVEASEADDDARMTFEWDLLNPGDWFAAKLLSRNAPQDLAEAEFTMRGESLPSLIRFVDERRESRFLNWVPGLTFFLLGAVWTWLAYHAGNDVRVLVAGDVPRWVTEVLAGAAWLILALGPGWRRCSQSCYPSSVG